MPKTLQPLMRQPSLHISVQEAVKNYILDNRLPPGSPLPPETELAKQLGVGRNSVREAVKALESLGVLETRRGMGLFVRDFSFEPLLTNLQFGLLQDLQQLADLWKIRRVLEIGMLEEAIQSMSETQLQKLSETTNQMRLRAENNEPFAQEDREFHQQLFEGLGNQVFSRILDIFWLTFNHAAQDTSLWDTDPKTTYRWHQKILQAVKAKDIPAAQSALNHHYDGLKQRLEMAQRKQKRKE